ncbi:hypothetical protein FACS189483_02480 [Spirochaetia bacterium]|nr:hypothetical protein FACS189483_02480 [Spirochaetia bacterium]
MNETTTYGDKRMNPNQTQAIVYAAAFLSVKQLAQALNCSKSNISVQIKAGKIPAVRIGAYPHRRLLKRS